MIACIILIWRIRAKKEKCYNRRRMTLSLTHAQPLHVRWYLPTLVLILSLGLLLRVWFWSDQATAWSVGLGDEDEYYRGAIHIFLQGNYYDTGKWLRPPVTSLYLAGAFSAFGVNLPLALLFESALSLLSVALTATLVRHMFRRDDYAAAVAAAVAFFLPYAAYASRVLSENLFIIFLALSLVLLERAQARLRARVSAARMLFFSGVALALAILTRAFLFYSVPLLFLWLWWERRNLLEAVRTSIPLVLGVVVLVAPWTIRNTLVYQQFVLVETEGGYSFLNGTEPGANEQALQEYWLKAYPNSAQRQQAQFAQGFENVRRAPLQWIGRMRDKVVGLWHLHIRNLANNGTRGATVQLGTVGFSLAADAEYVVLMLAALLGIALVPRDRLFLPLLGLPLYTTLVGAVTVTSVRIREPLMLTLMVYAAPVLADPRGAWRGLIHASRARQVVLAAAVGVFLVLIYSSSYFGFFRGQFWLALARVGGGEPAIRRAIDADPDNVFPHLALGSLQLARGDTDGALAALIQANKVMPDNTDVQAELIQVLRLRGEMAAARSALQPIVDAGWDNPQWYEWAWQRVPFAPHGEVDMRAPAVGVMRGVYPAVTEEGVPFRWTTNRAEFRLSQPDAKELTLRLRADQAKPVQAYMNGEFLQTIQVGPIWADYRLPLERPIDAQSVIELRVPAQVASVDEPYAHGVAVALVKLDVTP
jgi:4-amino-4-deoxy-L-arabinose transferase-like glycosyltransferase